MSALLLCLSACRNNTASIEQVHVLTWALRDALSQQRLMHIWDRQPGAPALFRAWNPDLEDTLLLARAAGLVVTTTTGRQALTATGKNFAEALRSMDVLLEERAFLQSLGRLSELGMWRVLGARPNSVAASGDDQ